MHFLLLTIGSHGDVHPFVGIGRALRARGHEVQLATNEDFRPLVERAGLTFIELGDKALFESVQQDPNVWHARRGPALIMQHLSQTIRSVYDVTVAHATADTVIVGSTLCLGSRIAAEQFGWRMVSVHLSPLCIRSAATMPVLPGNFNAGLVPGFLRQRFWEGADRWYIDPLICPAVNALRQEVGLAPVTRVQQGWWHSPDRTIGLWPDWFFAHQPDYPEQVRLAGFPLYDESDHVELPAELDAWIGHDDPPIAFTPGSAMRFGEAFFKAATDACVRLKMRGLLLSRHAHHLPRHLPENVRHVPFAPFGRLLPRCRAIAHHGGIGTTAQALRAGIPQLVMPMSHDQFDNGAICRRLGVGAVLSRRKFTGRRVAAAFRGLFDNYTVRAACERIAARAAQDRPMQTVVSLLESVRTSS